MKRVIPFLGILFLIGCTKDQEPDSIVGTWTLTEINTDNTSSVQLSRTEFSVEFTAKDSVVILGPKPNYSYLQDFNRYQILGEGRIRFFNTNNQEELFASFEVDKNLSLMYRVRCPYEEKFMRR